MKKKCPHYQSIFSSSSILNYILTSVWRDTGNLDDNLTKSRRLKKENDDFKEAIGQEHLFIQEDSDVSCRYPDHRKTTKTVVFTANIQSSVIRWLFPNFLVYQPTTRCISLAPLSEFWNQTWSFRLYYACADLFHDHSIDFIRWFPYFDRTVISGEQPWDWTHGPSLATSHCISPSSTTTTYSDKHRDLFICI